ncbi:granzyme B-like [Thalassophryne amazonica]|uniref:granzyme B-like n=1 Tax=Thalassophryne amazonica TaxID=390379 RepID=UPI001471292B|nr:granzyme B-like [Thalassophryne amazonica]
MEGVRGKNRVTSSIMHASCFIFLCHLFAIAGATKSGIVGGKVAKPHSRPYMASLQVRRHHTCGGILIRKDFVLTAAHCKQEEAMTVVLGAHNISKEEKSQQRIKVAEYYQHPKYKPKKFTYDIMLLKLKTNAMLNKYVKTIRLPKKEGKIPAQIKCNVAGWGRTGTNEPASDVLRETTEKTQFDSECINTWRESFSRQQMICTKFDKKTGGICQGDSGGPLMCNNLPQGIAAYTSEEDCNNPSYPHVFTKINFFIPWINNVMQKPRGAA